MLSKIREEFTSTKSGCRTENKKELLEINKMAEMKKKSFWKRNSNKSLRKQMGTKIDKNIRGQSSRSNRTKKMEGSNQMKKFQNICSEGCETTHQVPNTSGKHLH